MTLDREVKNYISELQSNITATLYSTESLLETGSYEDLFTEYCIGVLESIDKTETANVLSYIHPNSRGGVEWKVNGYCFRDGYAAKGTTSKTHYETLDLFVTYYKNDSYEYNLPKAELTKTINFTKNFINGALKGHIDYIDESYSELNSLINSIKQEGSYLDRINLFVLVNGFYSAYDSEKIILKQSNRDVYVHVWDIMRLYQIESSNSVHEPIKLDLIKDFEEPMPLPFLKAPNLHEDYECYLAIVPGELLSNLYKEYSTELLESNVRAFLGQAGKFNKGIRDTIINKPQMFLPYNNGITATAESVTVEEFNGSTCITSINDFQIVNGGQTTASLYHTKKKNKNVDLGNISVQMKLTVIKDEIIKSNEVPNISRFANSQNKVSELDLSSNNPFFIKIEQLSRKTFINNLEKPSLKIHYYFERTRGQYKEEQRNLTSAQKNKFKEINPLSKKFTKSDIAKYINLWNIKPHIVSRGSQKSFLHFIKEINGSKESVGLFFYKKLVGNMLLFKEVDSLFGRKNNNPIGDTNLKSYTVSYTIAFFHKITNNRLDLWKIFEDQRIDESFLLDLKELMKFIYGTITDLSYQKLAGEVVKNEKTWIYIQELSYDFDFIKTYPSYFISEEESRKREAEPKEDDSIKELNDKIDITNTALSLGTKFWHGFLGFLQKEKDIDISEKYIDSIIKKIKIQKDFTKPELTTIKKVVHLMTDQYLTKEEIQEYTLINEDIHEDSLLEAYIMLSELSNNDWSRYIALANHCGFNYQERINIDYVSKNIYSNKIKYRTILAAYASIVRLDKYKKI